MGRKPLIRNFCPFLTSPNSPYPVPLRYTQIAIATSDDGQTLGEIFYLSAIVTKKTFYIISNPRVISLTVGFLEAVVYFLAQLSIGIPLSMINIFLLILAPSSGIIIEMVSNQYVIFIISITSVLLGRLYYSWRLKNSPKNIQAEMENVPELAVGVVKKHLTLSFGASLTIIVSLVLALLKSFFPGLFYWL